MFNFFSQRFDDLFISENDVYTAMHHQSYCCNIYIFVIFMLIMIMILVQLLAVWL